MVGGSVSDGDATRGPAIASGPGRSHWGWGLEGESVPAAQRELVGAFLAARFGGLAPTPLSPPPLEALALPAPRAAPPPSIAHLCRTDAFARATHTYGKAFRDVVRGLAGDFAPAPDLVAYPGDEAEVARVLEVCAAARIGVIPFGGGSSVVGGVEARFPRGGDYAGALSLDLGRLDRVLEIDRTSRAARIQAGVLGPSLEAQLRPHGLTLRHYPQSFEFSSLGGWIATRAGGHYATLYTHIDDFVESLRVQTPRGLVETRRLPGSGAGPAPERLFLGSEGALGVITEAWMRLQDRPRFRATVTARFARFEAGSEAARALSQSGLFPTNCRLIDATEALHNGIGDGESHLLILGFESADNEATPDANMRRAIELVRDHGGLVGEGKGRTRALGDADAGPATDDAAAWREMFIKAPYLRDAIACLGYVVETFETAVTWDKLPAFHAGVMEAVGGATRAVCGAGVVSCRYTHLYPDGPAPYFTVIAPGAPGQAGRDRLSQWDEIKVAASEAIGRLGGTITHHHATGRDHRPGYDRERPPLFGEVLRAAKRTLDPSGILNPGVLVDV